MRENIDRIQQDRAALKDICDVRIDTTKPKEERIKSFVDQIGNPYCYRDGDIVVSIGYADTSVSLQDRLQSYITTLD